MSLASPAARPPKRVLAYFMWTTSALWHGVRAYAREAGWILVSPSHVHGPPKRTGNGDFDGVLLLVGSHELFDTRSFWPKAQIVDLQNTQGITADACLEIDNHQVGRMAVDYLDNLGYRNFLALSLNVKIHTLVRRLGGYDERVRELGLTPNYLDYDFWMPAPEPLLKAVDQSIKEAGLPLAVFSPDDPMADAFMQAVLELGYRIPEDVAILGSNNERGVCDMCRIPLSSIDVDFSRLGYEGARLLDRLMDGDETAPKLLSIPPVRVEKRRSTERMQTRDPIVRAIIEYIGEHFAEKITADDVIQHIHASRSAAFVRFRKVMGRSIGKEIENVRLSHARSLLAETDYKLDVVARLSGYYNTSAFCRAFKTIMGETPSDFRKRADSAAPGGPDARRAQGA